MIIGTIIFFFFNDTATTEIYTLSLHDALPIYVNNVEYYSYFDTVINTWLIREGGLDIHAGAVIGLCAESHCTFHGDRKSTRLNSSHANISYAVFCLKKKNNNTSTIHLQTK